MILRNRIVEDRLVQDGFWKLREVVIESESPGGRVERFARQVAQAREAAATLLIDPARGLVLLLRQFRTPPFVAHGAPALIEVCAGVLDSGEDPAACAVREALEETGAAVTAPRFVGRAYMSPGVCTERISLFIATYDSAAARATGGGLAHEGEQIEPFEVTLDDALAMIEGGEIVDAKTILLLQRAALERFGYGPSPSAAPHKED